MFLVHAGSSVNMRINFAVMWNGWILLLWSWNHNYLRGKCSLTYVKAVDGSIKIEHERLIVHTEYCKNPGAEPLFETPILWAHSKERAIETLNLDNWAGDNKMIFWNMKIQTNSQCSTIQMWIFFNPKSSISNLQRSVCHHSAYRIHVLNEIF